MKRTRFEVLLIGVTVLALCAGVVAGLVAARMPSAKSAQSSSSSDSGVGALAAELELTPDQQQQMRSIWQEVQAKVNRTFDDAQALQRERDQALVALLDDQQKAKFEKISKDYAQRFIDLSRGRDQTFNDAVERTKKLLSEQQREKYDQILKAHVRPPEPPLGPEVFSVPASGTTTRAAGETD
jgi:hypothetical protein